MGGNIMKTKKTVSVKENPPVIISPDNRIINGHARYAAYMANVAEECPAIIVSDSEQILCISDNYYAG